MGGKFDVWLDDHHRFDGFERKLEEAFPKKENATNAKD